MQPFNPQTTASRSIPSHRSPNIGSRTHYAEAKVIISEVRPRSKVQVIGPGSGPLTRVQALDVGLDAVHLGADAADDGAPCKRQMPTTQGSTVRDLGSESIFAEGNSKMLKMAPPARPTRRRAGV